MPGQFQNIINNSLRLVKECPSCHTKYEAKQVSVADRVDSGYLVYFSCQHCGNSLLARIVETPFGLIGSAMLTDLELNEVVKFKSSEPVSTNDVLAVYQELEHKK